MTVLHYYFKPYLLTEIENRKFDAITIKWNFCRKVPMVTEVCFVVLVYIVCVWRVHKINQSTTSVLLFPPVR